MTHECGTRSIKKKTKKKENINRIILNLIEKGTVGINLKDKKNINKREDQSKKYHRN